MSNPAAGEARTIHSLDRVERLVLVAIRRMAIHGLRDASASWLMLELFSARFRRPLVILRAFVLELSHGAKGRPIRVASCCSPNMTEDEATIMRLLTLAALDVDAAQDMLVMLTNRSDATETLSAAVAFSRALIEDYRPARMEGPGAD